MDKIIDVPALNHIIKLTDRKNIIISGIKKINSFDEKEFDLAIKEYNNRERRFGGDKKWKKES